MSQEQSAVVTEQPEVQSTQAQTSSDTNVSAPKQDQSVVAYQKIQGERDHYQSLSEREKAQVEKLMNTNKALENELAVTRITASNPHLKDVAALQDFSGKSVEEINAWGEAMTRAINSARGTTTVSATATVEAPSVDSAKAPAAPAQDISGEQFAKLSLADKKKYLQSKQVIG